MLLEPLRDRPSISPEEWTAYATDWLRYRPEVALAHVVSTHRRLNGREPQDAVRCLARAAAGHKRAEVWVVEEDAGVWYYRTGSFSPNAAAAIGSVASEDREGFRPAETESLLRRFSGRREIAPAEWQEYAGDWLTVGEGGRALAVEQAIAAAGHDQENLPNRLARADFGHYWVEIWVGGLDSEAWVYRFSDRERGPTLIGHYPESGTGIETDDPILQRHQGQWVAREQWQEYAQDWLAAPPSDR